MSEKHILLDWDGVVRTCWYDLDGERRDAATYSRLHLYTVPFNERMIQMIVDPDVVARINALNDRDHVRIYWISAVGRLVPDLMAPAVGLEDFAWLPTASNGQQGAPDDGPWSMRWWSTSRRFSTSRQQRRRAPDCFGWTTASTVICSTISRTSARSACRFSSLTLDSA